MKIHNFIRSSMVPVSRDFTLNPQTLYSVSAYKQSAPLDLNVIYEDRHETDNVLVDHLELRSSHPATDANNAQLRSDAIVDKNWDLSHNLLMFIPLCKLHYQL